MLPQTLSDGQPVIEPIESWQRAFRDGLAPLLSIPMLEAMRDGLEADDSRILQGATTNPPPLFTVKDWPIEGACYMTYPFVMTNGGFLKNLDGTNNPDACTVGDAEQWFATASYEMDKRLQEPAGSRWLLNWADEAPRQEVFTLLAAECRREIRRRCCEEAGIDEEAPDGIVNDKLIDLEKDEILVTFRTNQHIRV